MLRGPLTTLAKVHTTFIHIIFSSVGLKDCLGPEGFLCGPEGLLGGHRLPTSDGVDNTILTLLPFAFLVSFKDLLSICPLLVLDNVDEEVS